jgi:sortase A
MRDKRPVDELSIQELEQILAIRRREARQAQLQRMKREGRVVVAPEPPTDPLPAAKTQPEFPPQAANATPEPPLATSPETGHPEENGVDVDTPVRRSPPPVATPGIPRFEDDYEDVVHAASLPDDKGDDAWKRFINFALLLVEVAAVAGLLFIGYQMLTATSELEAETREAQRISNATAVAAIPTLEATPSLRLNLNDVVLPGGHVLVGNVAQPNLDEVPERYRNQLIYEYSQPVIQRPQATDSTPLRVSVPALNIDESITQGSDWEALKAGIGQVINGADPEQVDGNVVLAAHNDIYGELFRNLDQLKPGDQVTIQTREKIYVYEITHTEIVEPSQVEVLDSQGRATVTLISCYPHGKNDKRIVVFAKQVETSI